ncbi:MAG: SLBB domain-containing protein [Candidatus Hydrogenedentes bacterium]|nr:SLBB domain-containing protein [Candidatus Hydrogenedentota bacterium]
MPELDSIASLEARREEVAFTLARYRTVVTMCGGTACQACGCQPVARAMTREVMAQGLEETVYVRTTGCHGFCEQGPLVIIDPGGIVYVHVTPEDVPEIVAQTIRKGKVIERLSYTDPVSDKTVQAEDEIPFYTRQKRLLLGENRHIAPRDIDDYIARGGYSALAKALDSMTPEAVVEEIERSGLQGRGGGGYPTGKKWRQCRNASGDARYVICNADEGDPGDYMDRSLLEGNPHSIIEGMIIGAFAVGARHGYIYVRKEYPLAVVNAGVAIRQAQALRLLGEDILGTGFDFDIQVVRGGGAFVCGESTALMASLEGKVGEPRPKDIHTVERGYLGQPTVLNNVETWANVPSIIRHGADWFASQGTERSKGTKIFALTGQVKNTGLIEVEMGTTLREIIYDIGGGPKNGREIKAVQTGGPSGGCLPTSQFDLPVDFDALYEAGSMMGSGGMVVMDDSSCMVDVAKYFLAFLQDESCGKCTPCRLGVGRLLEIVTDISEGRGSLDQLDLLEDLSWTISVASLCALGKTAPNPVLSTLKYFRDEYLDHIENKRCAAGVCRALIRLVIDSTLCDRCGKCIANCPHKAITGSRDTSYAIDDELCTRCRICADACEQHAILVR